jgi:hypothetical protein
VEVLKMDDQKKSIINDLNKAIQSPGGTALEAIMAAQIVVGLTGNKVGSHVPTALGIIATQVTLAVGDIVVPGLPSDGVGRAFAVGEEVLSQLADLGSGSDAGSGSGCILQVKIPHFCKSFSSPLWVGNFIHLAA